jgi:type I restriction enzyme S subunit
MTRGYPEVNDVVLTTEAPLGEVALIKNKNIALAQRIITLRGYKNILDNKFLKYWLQSEQGQYELNHELRHNCIRLNHLSLKNPNICHL